MSVTFDTSQSSMSASKAAASANVAYMVVTDDVSQASMKASKAEAS